MSPAWHLDASDGPVPPGGLAQPLVGWIRFQKRVHEDSAVTAAEREHFMLPDSAGRAFPGATHNEFRKGPAGEISRMLEQRLLLVRNPGFKPCRLGCDVCGFAHDAI